VSISDSSPSTKTMNWPAADVSSAKALAVFEHGGLSGQAGMFP
jgi:hypothetical protein